MILLEDNKHAFILPPRCGTRWITSQLIQAKLLDKDFRGTHNADLSLYNEDLRTIMMVRNPFLRERSYYRWHKKIGEEKIKNLTFKEFIFNDELFFNSFAWSCSYANVLDLVDVFLDLKDINTFFRETFNIQLPEYDHTYHQPADELDDIFAYNSKMIERVLKKYEKDIELFNLSLAPFA